MPTVTVSPFGSFATGASPNQSAQLAPGQVIDALVLSLIKDTTFRLQLPTGTLDIQTDIPLVPGTRVELAVAHSDDRDQSFQRIATSLTWVRDGAVGCCF